MFARGDIGARSCAEILSLAEGVRGHPAPSRSARKEIADPLGSGTQGSGRRSTDLDGSGAFIPDVAGCLQERDAKGADSDTKPGHLIPVGETVGTLTTRRTPKGHGQAGPNNQEAYAGHLIPAVANTLRSAPTSDASHGKQSGDDRATLIPCAFDPRQITNPDNRSNPQPGAPCHTLPSHGEAPVIASTLVGGNGHTSVSDGVPSNLAVAFQTRIGRNGRGQPEEIAPTLNGSNAGATSDMRPCVAFPANLSGTQCASAEGLSPSLGAKNPTAVSRQRGVRRLTPRECERLQGFPDDWTARFSDSPRYRMIGNAVPPPMIAWVAKRRRARWT